MSCSTFFRNWRMVRTSMYVSLGRTNLKSDKIDVMVVVRCLRDFVSCNFTGPILKTLASFYLYGILQKMMVQRDFHRGPLVSAIPPPRVTTSSLLLRIRYWRKFDLEVADRRSRYQPRKKCPNRWRSHLLPRMRQFLKRASNGHQ